MRFAVQKQCQPVQEPGAEVSHNEFLALTGRPISDNIIQRWNGPSKKDSTIATENRPGVFAVVRVLALSGRSSSEANSLHFLRFLREKVRIWATQA